MDNRKLRGDLLLLFEEKTEFERNSYYNVDQITDNNVYIKSIFNQPQELLKLSFSEQKNKKYKRDYSTSPLLVISEGNKTLEKRLVKLYNSFLFFQKLLFYGEISLQQISEVLEGHLDKFLEEATLETRIKVFDHYGLVEKNYETKISPKSYAFKEIIAQVGNVEKEIESKTNRTITLRYKKPFTWFFKALLTRSQEEKIKELLI